MADIVLFIHVLYVSFVVVGFAAILAGWVGRWEWVRNFWFRLGHLAAMAFVALESLVGVVCPLTLWEGALRRDFYDRSFIGHWMNELIYYDLDEKTFLVIYVAFTAVVLGVFVLFPPRRPFGRNRTIHSKNAA
jgi:hypothetical protein